MNKLFFIASVLQRTDLPTLRGHSFELRGIPLSLRGIPAQIHDTPRGIRGCAGEPEEPSESCGETSETHNAELT
jgi:hypothetical protein